jgi:hypothetical protein
MKKIKLLAAYFLFFPFLILIASAARATEEYNVTCEQIENHKAFSDDPRPIFKEWGYKKILPPEVYTKMTYDVEAMKQAWAEVVGFKAPEVVGRIAPEIKPGIYTYQDKEKIPGLKTLMIPLHYDTFFKPGGPPHAGNFPEIEIVPTRQYYYALPIAEATKKYMDKTGLNDRGYLISESYEAGFPFPRPSGKFKAQQIMYNWEKRHTLWDNSTGLQHAMGFNKDLKIDFDSLANLWALKLQGRVMMEPYGWYDKRARKLGETRAINFMNLAPRDFYGNVLNSIFYLDPDKFDQYQAYINVLRRIRKLSGTDLQDRAVGQDTILDDFEGFNRKFSSKRYPWKFELIDEREYLVPAMDQDGSTYYSKKGLEIRNIKFERRPIYVVKLTQTDPNYIYSKTILYIDQETFLYHHIENYDQKARLYRTATTVWSDFVEMGMHTLWQGVLRDYVEFHSNLSWNFLFPATWVTREHVNLQSLIKGVK